MSRHRLTDEERRKIEGTVASEFVVDLINAGTKYFNVDYNSFFDILEKSGYWRVINDDGVACMAAHYTMDEVLQNIQEGL